MAKFCGKCGNPIKEGEIKCSKCGAPVIKSEPEGEDATPKKVKQPSGSKKYNEKKQKVFVIGGIIVVLVALVLAVLFTVGSRDHDPKELNGEVLDMNEKQEEKTEVSTEEWIKKEPLSKVKQIPLDTISYEVTYPDEVSLMDAAYEDVNAGDEEGTTAENQDERNGILCTKETDLDQNKKPELLVMKLRQEKYKTFLIAEIYEEEKDGIQLMDSKEIYETDSFMTSMQYCAIATIDEKPYLYFENGRNYNDPNHEFQEPDYRMYRYDKGVLTLVKQLATGNEEEYAFVLKDLQNNTSVPVHPYEPVEKTEEYGKYQALECEAAIREALIDMGLKATDNYLDDVGTLYGVTGFPTYRDTEGLEPVCSYSRLVTFDWDHLILKTKILTEDLTK